MLTERKEDASQKRLLACNQFSGWKPSHKRTIPSTISELWNLSPLKMKLKQAYNLKFETDGVFDEAKFRITGAGYFQQPGVDFKVSYATTASMN